MKPNTLSRKATSRAITLSTANSFVGHIKRLDVFAGGFKTAVFILTLIVVAVSSSAPAASAPEFFQPRPPAARHLIHDEFEAASSLMEKNMPLRYICRKCSFPGRVYIPRYQDVRGGVLP
jgi:hypothetical protein